MPSAAAEAAAQRVDDAVRAKDEDTLRDAVRKDDTRELGSLAVLRCAETGWIEGLRAAVEAGAIYRCKTASGASPAMAARSHQGPAATSSVSTPRPRAYNTASSHIARGTPPVAAAR